MSASTSQSSDDVIKVEKGPEGELKKTISTTPSSAETTSRKDDDKSTFRGPDSGGVKVYSMEELKKLKVTLEIRKRKAAVTASGAAIDPSSITPVRRPDPVTATETPSSIIAEDVGVSSEELVKKPEGQNEPAHQVEARRIAEDRRIRRHQENEARRPFCAFTEHSEDGSTQEEMLKGEGKVPLFSKLSSVNDGDEKTVKKEPASQTSKSDRDKPSSSRSGVKPRSRSRSRRRDYYTERDEHIRRKKEAYLKEQARREGRERERQSRRRSCSRSRSSSESRGSSSDSRSRSRSRSKSRSSHKSDKRHRRSRSRGRRRSGSRSRSRSREHRRRGGSRERATREDSRHHSHGQMPEMMPYPPMGGGPWGPRPPFIRHPMVPYPPIPMYHHGPMMYPLPFRPPPMMRGPPRNMLRRP